MSNHFPSREYNIMKALVPGPIENLIKSKDWSNALGELGQRVVETQLAMHAEAELAATERRLAQGHNSLLNQSAKAVIDAISGSDDFAVLKALPKSIVNKAIIESDLLAYPAFRSLRRAADSSGKEDEGEAAGFVFRDIDEWVLANERALRDDGGDDWKRGLVDWGVHGDLVFDPTPALRLTDGSHSAKVISRSRDLTGYSFLDECREPEIAVQPTVSDFRTAFRQMTDGLLQGLDWSNVFVAGGIVLSTLLSVTPAHFARYVNSDIDLYIHGLGPVEANAKMQHIFDVWKGNLPADAKESVIVVRNSRTITCFSQHPLKRLQIVLKLVKHPKEVLLNFDLDICAMGFDGETLLMLPRACRALETGYNVFTMDLVDGHYLGERRASQESRVFKYADKGYGLRILPSYLAADAPLAQVRRDRRGVDDLSPSDSRTLGVELKVIAEQAKAWTSKVFTGYEKLNSGRYNSYYYPKRGEDGIPEFTHSMLEDGDFQAVEPGHRSCLTGFEHLMRHVELWRLKVKGIIKMPKEEWASNNYDFGPNGYDDTPQYAWGPGFDINRFTEVLISRNRGSDQNYYDSVEFAMGDNGDWNDVGTDLCFFLASALHHLTSCVSPSTELNLASNRRITYGSNISEVLSGKGNVYLYLFVATGFVQYANAAICAVLEERGLAHDGLNEPLEVLTLIDASGMAHPIPRDVEAVRWQIDSLLGWQQIDRRIDEIFEILWSFYRSHYRLRLMPETLARKFYVQVARRAVRPSPTDEAQAFSHWVMRKAPPVWNGFSALGVAWDATENDGEDNGSEYDW